MGLDCTAYELIERLPEHEQCDECWDEGHIVFSPSPFPASEGSMKPGCYMAAGESTGWRAGSYSGYNAWRERLSLLMLGVPASSVWKEPDAYVGKPFFELIHFSDCEGVIGPEACAKLARDFHDYADRVPPAGGQWDDDTWFAELYATWSDAFHLAAHGGCVEFH